MQEKGIFRWIHYFFIHPLGGSQATTVNLVSPALGTYFMNEDRTLEIQLICFFFHLFAGLAMFFFLGGEGVVSRGDGNKWELSLIQARCYLPRTWHYPHWWSDRLIHNKPIAVEKASESAQDFLMY